MGSVEYEEQVKQLIEMELLDEAISLLEQLESVLLESKEEKIREVQMLKAENLFQKRKYRESMELFADVEAPPERVIRIFPRIIAGDLSIVEVEEKRGSVDERRNSNEGERTLDNNTVDEDGPSEVNETDGDSADEQDDDGKEKNDPNKSEESIKSPKKDKETHGNGIEVAPVIASLRRIADDVASIRSKKLGDDGSDSASIRDSVHKKETEKKTPSILGRATLFLNSFCSYISATN